jgi:ribosomal protein S18 acetylase RimI-like enzyme
MAVSPQTPQGYGAYLGRQLESADALVLIAERAGEAVGYVYAGLEGPDYMALRGPAGVLYDIIVDPASRGHGVGRALLDAALDALRERGAPRVVLSTAERNDVAQRLFAHAGFRRTMIEMTRELDT